MTSRVGPAPASNKTTSETLRPFIMAAALLLLLGLAAGVAYLVTGGSGHTLTVTKPTGGTLRGGDIRCGTDGNDCSMSVTAGQVVELSATPDDGFAFSGYTGDCAPVGRVLMGGPRTCGAEFAKDEGVTGRTWPLTITPAAGGTILSDVGHQCGGQYTACTVSVAEGTTVKIEGYTDPGYSVAAYTGDCAPQGSTTMTQARTCSASFVQFKVANGPATGTLPPPTTYGPLPPGATRAADPIRPPAGGGPAGGRDRTAQ
ncbi:MAG TPA: hypothetical protein VMF13_04345, partial [Luteitalea sp.]|nr:hypothetical protein [Luteitalea sp.]